jgi:hypothetical protein
LLPAAADAVLDEILATQDVAEIFVRGFRWAVRSKSYVMGLHDIMGATARAPRYAYENTFKVFEGVLRNAALPRMRAHPDRARRTLLPDDLAAWLRSELRGLLVRADDRNVFPVLLALLDAIDRELYELLWDDFYRRSNGHEAAAVRADRPFPKPVPALGSRDLSWGHRQSERGELPEYLEMEQYFGRLSVSARQAHELPRALHAWSEQGDGARAWRVAVVSVLSGVDDLDWQRPEGDRRFWATSFRTPEARAAVLARLIRAIDLCHEHQADLILIPELNVDGEIHAFLLELLKDRAPGPGSLHPMVIAGCLHERAPGEAHGFRNRPVVLTPRGAVPWSYHKVAGAKWYRRKEALCEAPPEVVAIDTPMGRIAVAMCLDFITGQVVDAIVDLRASVVVVLSMTSSGSVNLFTAKAAELAASNHAVTVFCNSSVHLRPPERDAEGPWTLGFVYPHTTGTERPLCKHELLDLDSVATVAVYELKYCSRDGLKGTKVLDEPLSAESVAALVVRPTQRIGDESSDAPATDGEGPRHSRRGPAGESERAG